MPVYKRSDIKATINRRIHNKIGMMSDPDATVNDAVREVVGMVDLRSMKRRSQAAPNLFPDIYQYAWPSDAKGTKIIDLQPQDMDRNYTDDWVIVDEAEFDQRKNGQYNMLSFSHRDMQTKLLASINEEPSGYNISPLDSLTGANTWTAFGDAENLAIDNDYYITSRSSLKFDLSAAGGTTAGIESSDLTTFDLTRVISYGSAFVWVWLTSATGVSNFKLRLGADSTNYYEMTATTTSEGLAFQTGWNLIRFDFSGKSTVLSPSVTINNYAAVFMTKLGSKISETDYRFDNLMVKHGRIRNIVYYSRYPWQNSAGAYLENSTNNDDYLNVESDEYTMILEKCIEWAADEVREPSDATKAGSKFIGLLREYRKNYKSEALPHMGTYYNI